MQALGQVSLRNSIVSVKTSGSGQNGTSVPVFWAALPFVSFFVTLPRANAIV